MACDSFMPVCRLLAVHQLLHEADIVVLRQISVFLQIGSFMEGHAFDEVFNKFIRD